MTEKVRSMLRQKLKWYLNDCITFYCVYQFIFVFGHVYIRNSNSSLEITAFGQKQIKSTGPIRADDKHSWSSIAKHNRNKSYGWS